MWLLSPAKINLVLRILNRREDGYHSLSMVMEKVSLCDEIVLEKTDFDIEVVMEPSSDIPLEKNLAWRAASLLREVSGSKRGVKIGLKKAIPMGGGLGGGSSNAAAVLKGLNKLWELDWPVPRLAGVGVQLGADVPFFLYDGPAWVEGIGDKITPLKRLPKLAIILINPGVPVSTPWAYQMWDANKCQALTGQGGKDLTQENQSVRPPCTFQEVLEGLHNDFEAVVFPHHPEIRRAKEALLKAGAEGALMSGSGSTVFGVFETKGERDRALGRLKIKPDWRVFAAENHWGVDKR